MNEKGKKRSARMSLNLTPEERDEFKAGAEIAGLNPNDYCLELHRKGAVITESNSLDEQGLRALTTFTNNFNQLTKKVNQLSDGKLNNPKSIDLIKVYLARILEVGKAIQVDLTNERRTEKEDLLGLINRLEIQINNIDKVNAELRKAISNSLNRLGA